MKVGEHWKHLNGGMSVMSDSLRGKLVEIIGLEDGRDIIKWPEGEYVYFILLEDDYGAKGFLGCLGRKTFLNEFIKVYSENQ